MIIRRAFGLLVSIFLVAAPRVAFAHAHLVKSVPSAGTGIAAAPHMIQLWFSEAPEASLTTITLTAENGRMIQLGPVRAVPDTSVSVMATVNGVLAPGSYTVKWRTVAADDGHPSNGSFSFTVTAVGSTTGTATAPAGGAATAISTEPNAGSNTTSGMDVESPVYVIVRWLSFMGLVLLVGVIAFRIFVLPRVGASPALALAQAGTHRVLIETMIPRLAMLGLVAALMVVIAAIGRLLAEQSVMAASMTMDVMDIVRQTTWGSAWLLQIGAAIVACAGFALARGASRRSAIGWGIATIAALVLAVTPALSGHAAGMPHWRTFAVATDAVHVIAAGAWLGSLCALVVVGLPAAVRTQARNTSIGLSNGVSTGLMADMVNAFSPIALTFAAIVVLTGLISAWLRLGSVSALWRTSYGVVLLIKLALVGGVFAAGAFNWLRMRSALARHALDHAASDRGESTSLSSNVPSRAGVRFQRSGTFELVFGVLVIAVTAVLVAMPTPVH